MTFWSKLGEGISNFSEKLKPNLLAMSLYLFVLAVILVVSMFTFLNKFVDEENSLVWTAAILGSMVTLFITLLTTIVVSLASVMNTIAEDKKPKQEDQIPAHVMLEFLKNGVYKNTQLPL